MKSKIKAITRVRTMPATDAPDWFPPGTNLELGILILHRIEFENEVSLDNLFITSSYAGSTAVTTDPKKFVKVQGENGPLISLYAPSGPLTAEFTLNSGQLVELGWSHQEELLCVQDDGMVLIYDLYGNYQSTFSMGNEAKNKKVISATVFTTVSITGVCVRTTTNQMFIVTDIADPEVKPF